MEHGQEAFEDCINSYSDMITKSSQVSAQTGFVKLIEQLGTVDDFCGWRKRYSPIYQREFDFL